MSPKAIPLKGRFTAATVMKKKKLLDRFRNPGDPLKFLIVTSKLLSGFDAPLLQVMYLDKPMRDHNLLQAICRTKSPYQNKDHACPHDKDYRSGTVVTSLRLSSNWYTTIPRIAT